MPSTNGVNAITSILGWESSHGQKGGNGGLGVEVGVGEGESVAVAVGSSVSVGPGLCDGVVVFDGVGVSVAVWV
ncbi:MAG: hypothetical protein GTO14_24200 [Anaerolineales bacterium]|nr:hypothetical protein [Anaerolineales bacterium]